MRAVNKKKKTIKRGLITAITIINMVILFCLLFENGSYSQKYTISKAVNKTNVRLGDLVYKITYLYKYKIYIYTQNLYKEK